MKRTSLFVLTIGLVLVAGVLLLWVNRGRDGTVPRNDVQGVSRGEPTYAPPGAETSRLRPEGGSPNVVPVPLPEEPEASERMPLPPTEKKEPRLTPPSERELRKLVRSHYPQGEIRANYERKLDYLRMHKEAILPILLKLLTNPKEESLLRESILIVIERIDLKSTVPTLLQVARKDSNWRIRRRAIKSIGAIGDASVAPDVIRLLEGAKSRHERIAAVSALGELGNTESLPVVNEISFGSGDPYLQVLGKRALRKINIENSHTKESELVSLLHGDDRWLKTWAVRKTVEAKYVLAPHYLREVYRAQLNLPRDKQSGYLQYALLSGIQKVGGELTENERGFLESHGFSNPAPIKPAPLGK